MFLQLCYFVKEVPQIGGCVLHNLHVRGSVVGWGTSQKVARSIPVEVIGFLNWPNYSSRNMALGSTQPLKEMSTRNLPGGRRQPTCKTDNLTAFCEQNV
jgi:hypothetical protein